METQTPLALQGKLGNPFLEGLEDSLTRQSKKQKRWTGRRNDTVILFRFSKMGAGGKGGQVYGEGAHSTPPPGGAEAAAVPHCSAGAAMREQPFAHAQRPMHTAGPQHSRSRGIPLFLHLPQPRSSHANSTSPNQCSSGLLLTLRG